MSGADVAGARCEDDVAGHGPTLLRKTGHIQHRTTHPGNVRCHPENCTNGDYSSAANTSEHDAELAVDRS